MPKTERAVDVVYILGKDSKWGDREIMYSIRSVERFLKNYRNIVIVGHKPEFLGPEVVHIPYTDIFGNKARNIMAKIHRAASDARVTGDFLLLNDDYFLLKETDALTYPYYYKCSIQESMKRNSLNADYLLHLQSTLKLLKLCELPTKNFDTHFPILYNKKKFREVCFRYDWAVPYGYIMKSVYCNSLNIPGIQIEDCKINHPHLYWENATKGMHVFSIGDKSICRTLTNFLNSLFPKPSKYEAGGLYTL